jgi:hypothetical protein
MSVGDLVEVSSGSLVSATDNLEAGLNLLSTWSHFHENGT